MSYVPQSLTESSPRRGRRFYPVAAIELARPFNCLMSAFAVLLGALAATSGEFIVFDAVLAMLCGAVITAGGNTINDYYDVEIDRVNHPQRPIPSGRIGRSGALWLSGLELAAGLLCGVLINWQCGVIASMAILSLLAYEAAGLKNIGLPGNIAISLLTGLLFVTGGAAMGDALNPISLGVLAFVASLGREIIKDIEDMTGDTGRLTWPMRVGVPQARLTAVILLVLAILLSPLPFFTGATMSEWYLLAVGLADGLFVWTIYTVYRHPGRGSRASKVAMLAVMGAFLIGVTT